MPPSVRKFALTAHVAFSVGWLGAVVAYLALAVVGVVSHEVEVARGAYVSMEFIGWFVIVPFSLAAMLTGLVESLGTSWGLFRHWWIVVKFLLTGGSTIVLLRHMRAVSRMSGVAADTTFSVTDLRALRIQLVVHAAGGLLVLIAVTALSIYKPWGITAYGRRKQHERPKGPSADVPAVATGDVLVRARRQAATRTPRWVYVVGIHSIGLALLFVVLHLTGGGSRGH
jgi:hypothetical protein